MKKKMNKKVIVSVVCIVLTLIIIAGALIVFLPQRTAGTTDGEASDIAEKNSETVKLYETVANQTEREEATSPPEGHTPIPDLEDGNEIYLDADVIDKLQQMEDAGKEDEVNLILDTMLPLINEFARQGYSTLAICQIQRLYFEFYEDIGNIDLDLLCDKIGECIPSGGLVEREFPSKAFEQFGFDESTDYSYIYSAEVKT